MDEWREPERIAHSWTDGQIHLSVVKQMFHTLYIAEVDGLRIECRVPKDSEQDEDRNIPERLVLACEAILR